MLSLKVWNPRSVTVNWESCEHKLLDTVWITNI